MHSAITSMLQFDVYLAIYFNIYEDVHYNIDC